MAAAPRHISVAEYKRWARVQVNLDDGEIESAIVYAEQELDNQLCRNLVTADTVATPRKFVPASATELYIDDAAEITAVSNYGASVTVSGLQLEPLNNRSEAGEYMPTDLLYWPRGSWYRCGREATVTVTAKWGWTTLPSGLPEVVKIATKATLDGRDIRFGLVDIAQGGGVGEREARIVRQFFRTYAGHRAIGIG